MKAILHKTKHALVILFSFLLAILALESCKEEPTIKTQEPGYYTAYNYFPSEDGYKWEYQNTTTNGNDSMLEQVILIGIYSQPSKSINYTVDNQTRGYANWYNYGSKLICCNGNTLIDYTKLECAEDSILIQERSFPSSDQQVFTQLYQFCERKYPLVEGYEGTASVKTLQTNTWSDGSQLVIERYFGFGIGLLYEIQVSYDVGGKVDQTEIKELTSHKF
jgi:hypothetical protein